jgi:hemolysin activation/secretion protein
MVQPRCKLCHLELYKNSIGGTGAGFIVNFSRYLTGRFNLAGPLQNESNIKHFDFEFYM